jgi:hypothetical protein
MPKKKWHVFKEGQRGKEKKKKLLVFSELPRVPSAGS